jgi:hypothetical protein
MATPIYLADEFLSLPPRIRDVLLQEVGSIDESTALSVSQLGRIWGEVVAAQSELPEASDVLARAAVSYAAFCDLSSAPGAWGDAHSAFVELEMDPFAMRRWRSVRKEVERLRQRS